MHDDEAQSEDGGLLKIVNINIPHSSIKVQYLWSNCVRTFIWYNRWKSVPKIL